MPRISKDRQAQNDTDQRLLRCEREVEELRTAVLGLAKLMGDEEMVHELEAEIEAEVKRKRAASNTGRAALTEREISRLSRIYGGTTTGGKRLIGKRLLM